MLNERLDKDSRIKVCIRVQDTKSIDIFHVVGRGELQLSILAETLRREGFEMALSRPEAISKEIDGVLHEPIGPTLCGQFPHHGMGAASEMLGPRKAKMLDMVAFDSRVEIGLHHSHQGPDRAAFGNPYRDQGVSELINSHFEGWIPWQGAIPGIKDGGIGCRSFG